MTDAAADRPEGTEPSGSDALGGGRFDDQLSEATDELDERTGRYADARDAHQTGDRAGAAEFEDEPDTQGQDPLVADLGDDGQGDISPEDL